MKRKKKSADELTLEAFNALEASAVELRGAASALSGAIIETQSPPNWTPAKTGLTQSLLRFCIDMDGHITAIGSLSEVFRGLLDAKDASG